MSYKRTATDVTPNGGASVVVGANQTAAVVSKQIDITSRGDQLLVSARVSSVTQTSNNAVLKLQHASTLDSTGTPIWSDVAGASVTLTTAAGQREVDIRIGSWNSANLASLPLGFYARLVAHTEGGDAVTVEQVLVLGHRY